jgi:hypothetical protein
MKALTDKGVTLIWYRKAIKQARIRTGFTLIKAAADNGVHGGYLTSFINGNPNKKQQKTYMLIINGVYGVDCDEVKNEKQ